MPIKIESEIEDNVAIISITKIEMSKMISWFRQAHKNILWGYNMTYYEDIEHLARQVIDGTRISVRDIAEIAFTYRKTYAKADMDLRAKINILTMRGAHPRS